MDKFSIHIFDSAEPEWLYNEKCYYGQIVIGEFSEQFNSPIEYWNASDYRKQWTEALQRITGGADLSCLITSMKDPQSAEFIVWWPMYRVGKTVFIQNQLMFLKDVRGEFEESNPYLLIQSRETMTDDGEPISEWETTVVAIRNFLTTNDVWN